MHDFTVCLFNPSFRGCQNPINGLCTRRKAAPSQPGAESASTRAWWVAAVQTVGVAERDVSKQLAEVRLSTLAVNAELRSDNTVHAAAVIESCTVFDRRPAKHVGITRYRYSPPADMELGHIL